MSAAVHDTGVRSAEAPERIGGDAAEVPPSDAKGCCGQREQATCCAPEAKASCCGSAPAGGCGCR